MFCAVILSITIKISFNTLTTFVASDPPNIQSTLFLIMSQSIKMNYFHAQFGKFWQFPSIWQTFAKFCLNLPKNCRLERTRIADLQAYFKIRTPESVYNVSNQYIPM